jgi:proteasome lid subunit RPN8/RPN11
VRIARPLYDEIVAHALEDAPNECCGIVATVEDEATRVYRAENVHASPFRYQFGNDLPRIVAEIDDAGWTLGAIYHSHTRSEPRPSQTDINLALAPGSGEPMWPGSLYIIVGVAGAEPEVRAWRIESTTPEEVALSVS